MASTPFTEADYIDRKFKGLIYQAEKIVAIDFDECEFIDCSFRETVFKDCGFRDCTFKDCDLGLVQVTGSSFTATKFHDSQLIGVNWTEADWNSRGFLKAVDFSNCVINYSTFMGLKLKDMNISGCIAKEVDFTDADLTKANFRNTDLTSSRFLNTNLTEADFMGATNYAIAANLNILKKTKFSLPEAMSLLYSLDIILSE